MQAGGSGSHDRRVWNGSATVGLIVGNRGFFPAELCDRGREEMLGVLGEHGFEVVALSGEDTEFGSVESLEDAAKCARLFREHGDEIDGIVVTLPNFGDERAVANAIRGSRLDVPVLVHAFPDEAGKLAVDRRRDSFCGKLSVCCNLTQYGIAFSLTSLHTCDPRSAELAADLVRFEQVCRIVFHCSNLPKRFFETISMSFQEILAGTVGKERSYGTLYGRIKAEPATYLRVSTDDASGKMRAYVGEGRFTDDPVDTFGGYGVVEVPRLQELLRFICRNGFEHHIVMNLSQTAEAVREALETYLGWDVYLHA